MADNMEEGNESDTGSSSFKIASSSISQNSPLMEDSRAQLPPHHNLLTTSSQNSDGTSTIHWPHLPKNTRSLPNSTSLEKILSQTNTGNNIVNVHSETASTESWIEPKRTAKNQKKPDTHGPQHRDSGYPQPFAQWQPNIAADHMAYTHPSRDTISWNQHILTRVKHAIAPSQRPYQDSQSLPPDRRRHQTTRRSPTARSAQEHWAKDSSKHSWRSKTEPKINHFLVQLSSNSDTNELTKIKNIAFQSKISFSRTEPKINHFLVQLNSDSDTNELTKIISIAFQKINWEPLKKERYFNAKNVRDWGTLAQTVNLGIDA
ncbi:hypothetical protein TSAR_016978 [Trichomalopsis sarcophagae]|uniref:Uncharacterized protein n=1 Tax=Trichomalopsis sarcophagae TaxID=543379 RepID=A0A232F761_9HYME|nr:hypothetical protein TSAR_016978 [Trichomalopsis sarcophagae]